MVGSTALFPKEAQMPRASKSPAGGKEAAPAKAASKPAAKTPEPKPATAAVAAAPPKKSPAKKAADPPAAAAAPAPAATPAKAAKKAPVPKGEGKFLDEQRALLLEERRQYEEQAVALKAEADQLAAEMEPGDVQFDDESGEGDTINVERERDLALSAQARAAVDEIDRALAKIDAGTYGICERCGQPIPKARLKALPYAALCVACKSGGLSSRR